MNLKARLARMEQKHAVKPVQALDCPNARQWLNDTITAINNGTHQPTKPRKPLSPDASPTHRWLDEVLNEIEVAS
ncbi:hypothetical protein [Methylobacter sp. BBA5.1]|uniref:hypothetical protein n=1 Tax=Methylobacter sp. BBA5.1 TaxID=1495064 RepID=UPI001267B25B|nr:hypothetical protein [Methylobacter sp. BBA5.1]